MYETRDVAHVYTHTHESTRARARVLERERERGRENVTRGNGDIEDPSEKRNVIGIDTAK